MDMRGLAPGDSLELAQLDGAGVIRHIYFTIIGPDATKVDYLRDLVLRMYWNGEADPSVEVPFGDFFGQGQGRIVFFKSQMVTVNPGSEMPGVETTLTVGFNCYFPMPYAKGARLVLSNDGFLSVPAVWYHIDYETVDRLPEDTGLFHAQYNQQKPTTAVGPVENINVCSGLGENTDGAENYVILDAQGRGNIAGYFLNIDNKAHTWYGEGDDMIFIDDDTWPPSFHGTGSEEIFGGGACPNLTYSGPYTGFHFIENKDFFGGTSMYRFYTPDPIHFQKSIRMTIEHGHNNNFANDYSSTVFWYQTEPHAPFPALPAAEKRAPRALAVPLPQIPEGSTIVYVGNEATSYTGDWHLYAAPSSFRFKQYWTYPGLPVATFTWSLGQVSPGEYELYAWVPKDPEADHASDAPYTITHANGVSHVAIDQSTGFEQWKSLGVYTIDANSKVTLENAASNNVVADALRAQPVLTK